MKTVQEDKLENVNGGCCGGGFGPVFLPPPVCFAPPVFCAPVFLPPPVFFPPPIFPVCGPRFGFGFGGGFC